ncbi:MAG: GTP-binding protein, partial [Cyanobacteria bacterium J06632_19]
VGESNYKNYKNYKVLSPSSLQYKIESSSKKQIEAENFMSISFQNDKPLSVEKFNKFLDEQLPKTVFRAKGIIWYKGSKLRHILQLCGKRCNFQRDEWTSPPRNQLVFIGQNLDAQTIKSQLEKCVA